MYSYYNEINNNNNKLVSGVGSDKASLLNFSTIFPSFLHISSHCKRHVYPLKKIKKTQQKATQKG